MRLTKDEKKAIIKFLLFIFVGLPLIIIASPYIIATALLVGDLGGTAVIGAIRRLFS